ncbi:MAG: dihydroorotate dehydrogenase-like protein [Phycisphaeraceae bacterium]
MLEMTYMGFTLPNPLIVGASPMVRDLDMVKRLEDGGAAMIVFHSLFEEQLLAEEIATARAMDLPADSSPEALTYFPAFSDFQIGPHEYLEQLRRVKEVVDIPVIGSLNGVTEGGWLRYARLMQDAGADGLELNIYDMPAATDRPAAEVEATTLQLVRKVRDELTIPLAVKLSPFYTALPNFASQLADAGADAIVLFNRFYQPDIDVEALEVRRLQLSDSSELLLRLHWIAMLHGRVNADLAVTGGVHTAIDVLKSVMAGASGVQLVSALLRHGPTLLLVIQQQLVRWLEEHEYQTLVQARGSMSLLHCPDPHAYQRANYMQMLESWRGAEPHEMQFAP